MQSQIEPNSGKLGKAQNSSSGEGDIRWSSLINYHVIGSTIKIETQYENQTPLSLGKLST